MATPCIPSLSTAGGFLKNVHEKAAHILTHFIYNPNEVSDYFEDQQCSLRQLAAEYQHAPELLVAAVKDKLSMVYSRNIPEMNIMIDISYADIDGVKYKLIFNITGSPLNSSNYKPLILNGDISVDSDYRITLKYKQ